MIPSRGVALQVVAGFLVLLVPGSGPAAQSAPLGQLSFPTSVQGPAHDAFVGGVLALHNFEYEEAIAAFRRAQKQAPDFAMAYWGEAFSYVQPLWYHEDLSRARAALARLGPTAAARSAKAPTVREQGYLEALETLLGQGPRPARFTAFAERLEVLARDFPDDHEARLFAALARLASVPEGTRDPAVASKAGELAAAVLAANPLHPGAAHYVLHAYDDGEQNAKALDAARRYARIAPGSSHARHMPSHAFLPLGLWDEATEADEAAYRASKAWVLRTGRPLTQQDFHSLAWLQYGYLQQGRFARARDAIQEVERALASLDARPRPRGPGDTGPPAGPLLQAPDLPVDRRSAGGGEIGRGYDRSALRNERGALRARLIIESGDWQAMRGQSSFDNVDELFALGLSSVALEDYPRAEASVRELGQARTALPDRDAADVVSIMRDQLQGLIAIARGDHEVGLAILARAARREAARPKPIARPSPPKPAGELYAEALAGLGQHAAAVDVYHRVLQRTPNRALALLGLARAAAAAGQRAEATRSARAFLRLWHAADSDRPELREATRLAR